MPNDLFQAGTLSMKPLESRSKQHTEIKNFFICFIWGLHPIMLNLIMFTPDSVLWPAGVAGGIKFCSTLL